MRNSSTSIAKDNVFPCHHILDHYVISHVVGGMQGTYVQTVRMWRSRWQLVRIFSSHVLRDSIFSIVDIKSTRIWRDNIWPKFFLSQLWISWNTKEYWKALQMFSKVMIYNCSARQMFVSNVMSVQNWRSVLPRQEVWNIQKRSQSHTNHAWSLERFTLNVLIIFIWVGKKLLHQ